MRLDIRGTIIQDDEQWIYDWFGEPATSPGVVLRAIDKAKGEDLDIYLSSPGGDVFAGSEIYSALRTYKGAVRIHVTGMACSAASVIMCSGWCEIAPTAQVMVHNASMWSGGDYHDMDKASEILQKVNESVAAAYVEKTGMSLEDALALMDRETWMTAADALELGLVDAIEQSEQQKDEKPLRFAAASGGLLPRSVIEKMQAERIQIITDLRELKGKEV